MPDEQAAVVFDPGLARLDVRHFVTAGDAMSLSGQTSPDAQIVVRAADGAARVSAYADGAGRFGINVPLQADEETFAMEVIAPSGFASQDRFAITVDRSPPRIEFEAPPPSVTAIEWLPLRGLVDGGVELLVDGEAAQLIEGSFDRTVTLQQGANDVELVATDLVGNVGVEKLEIFLDQEPPQLVRQAVSRSASAGGAAFTVDVVASDTSGVTQAAPFTLRVGDRSYGDFLRYNPASQSYRATVVVPGAASAAAVLEDVELEDYAGNRKRYTFR